MSQKTYARKQSYYDDINFMTYKPYQLGIWLAQYIRPHCQLCYCHLSEVHLSQTYPSNTEQHQQESRKRFSSLQSLDTGILCRYCHHSIDWLPTPMTIEMDNVPNQSQQQWLSIQPISYYQPPIDQIIRNFKFHEDLRMLPILLHMLRQLPPPTNHHFDNSVIIAMPTTAKRVRKRGFDPLSILMPYLSEHWQIPLWQEVSRVDDSVSQRGLSRIERQRNIQGAFALDRPLPVNKVILFDDVATTGSSLKELARTLLQNSHKELQISAYCLAHGHSRYGSGTIS